MKKETVNSKLKYYMQAKKLFVQRMELVNFRSYHNFAIDYSDGPIVIHGQNGLGKTNLLEAVSLLAPGRGLRSAKLSDMDNKISNSHWKLNFIAETTLGRQQIALRKNEDKNKRVIEIDGEKMRNQASLLEIFSIVWLTPQMDQVFQNSASDRRKFFDRQVCNFDPYHASHIAKYEYYMRERAKLLQSFQIDENWISILETKMAEMGVAIASARVQAVEYLQASILEAATIFPKAILSMIGEVEGMIDEMPSLQVEEFYKDKLRNYREIDKESCRTNYGIHRSDLEVVHIDKNMPAGLCSTGEQKALLISIILAEARAKIKWRNVIPVILFDEIVAHLDLQRREALLDEIQNLGAQTWMTGTDEEAFAPIKGRAQFIALKEMVSLTF
jgi:DNA replication and repair protein RecF